MVNILNVKRFDNKWNLSTYINKFCKRLQIKFTKFLKEYSYKKIPGRLFHKEDSLPDSMNKNNTIDTSSDSIIIIETECHRRYSTARIIVCNKPYEQRGKLNWPNCCTAIVRARNNKILGPSCGINKIKLNIYIRYHNYHMNKLKYKVL